MSETVVTSQVLARASTTVLAAGVCFALVLGTIAAPVLASASAAAPEAQSGTNTKFSSISAGPTYVCGVQVSASLVCWGTTPGLSTRTKLSNPPSGKFLRVASGESEACAIKKNGSSGPVVCWGVDTLAPKGRFRQVSEGYATACGIRDGHGPTGKAVCWWALSGKLQTQRHRGHYVQISAGLGQGPGCGVKRHGSVSCWGYRPITRTPQGKFIEVSVGGNSEAEPFQFACGLRRSGRVVCWGDGARGPMVAAGGKFTQVSSGGQFACGLRRSGRVVCWGQYPSAPKGRFTQISSGDHFVCAVKRGGEAVCSGENSFGQTEVPAAPFAQVSAGDQYDDCGVRVDGSLTCWGTLGNTLLPGGHFTQVSLGHLDGDWGCALRTDRSIACWTAYPSITSQGETSPPKGRFTQVSAGGDAACAVRVSQSIACWGNRHHFGVVPAGRFADVSVGLGYDGDFACGVRLHGHLVCWGDKLGYGGRSDGQTSPPAGKFGQVEAGLYGACGLRRRGSAACWGEGLKAKVPRGRFTNISDAGLVCAVRPTHALLCWDWNVPAERHPGHYVQASVNYEGGLCAVQTNGGIRCPGVVIPAAEP